MRFILLNKNINWIFTAAIILCALFTTCEMSMGLGEPIDTVPPNVFIESPQDNTKMKAISLGNPIVLEGTWNDDIGVTSLQFQIIDKWKGNAVVIPSRVNFNIITTETSNDFIAGTWTAGIVINAETATEYRIRVYAVDKFGNKGMAEVNVQIDIIPPWVDNIKIQKHPDHPAFANSFIQDSNNYTSDDTDSISGKRDCLPNIEYYIRKGVNFNNVESWRDIKYDDIDEFQNDFFRISADLISTFNNVAATRLNIFRENGVTQINQEPIKPSGYKIAVQPDKSHLRFPYWDITHAQLAAYDMQYAGGPHYISFEIRAWSETDWEGDDITGNPNKDPFTDQEELGRSQRIGGTVWFPESNNPIICIDKKLIIGDTNAIILTLTSKNALDIDVYDDDLLSEIYLGFIPKSAFDGLRGNTTESQFLESLADDGNSDLRTSVMNACLPNSGEYENPKGNLYSETPGNNNRKKTLHLNTGVEGEYRFIAIVKEATRDKNDSLYKPGYSYPSGISNVTAKWSVYPPLRVQIQAAMAPLIIVENPLKENAFPNLNSDGQTFKMSGYTLAGSKVNKMFIAWVPQGKGSANAAAALAAAETALPSEWDGKLYTHSSGVKVWDIDITDQGQELFGSSSFYKTSFTKTFDLLTDFPDAGGVSAFNSSTKDNLFVIQANAANKAVKNYHMFGSSKQPAINVISHTANTNYHDRNKDLVFKMQVGTGDDGVALKLGSYNISDITGDSIPTGLSAISKSGFNEYEAKILSSHIMANFTEGSVRVYKFEVENILGNKPNPDTLKTVVMSNAPLIEQISCNNGSGIYAQGERLLFDVTFSMPLLVEGTRAPKLKLYFNSETDPAPNAYATYVPSADPSKANNLLQFEYTVQLNDASPQLKNSLAPIDLNGALLQSYYGTDAVITLNNYANSIQTKTVQLDGVKPKVLRAWFGTSSSVNGPFYYNNGKTITINLICDEPVMVSGSPKVRIQAMGQVNNNAREAEYSSKTGNTLSFTYDISDENDPIDQERQITWADPWITFGAGDDITDAVGNTIATSAVNRTIPPTTLPADERNRRGDTGAGYSDNKQAFVKSNTPAAPVLTIHNTQTGASAATASDVLSGNPLNVSSHPSKYNTQNFYIRAAGIETTNTFNKVFYSFTGGSSPNSDGDLGGAGAYRYSTANTGRITDADYNNRNKSSYVPSSYQVTVWQEDRAGNKSANAVTRNVNINSRPADLTSIDINNQDGSHRSGTVIGFRLSFSQKITLNSGARVRISIKGTDADATGTADIDTNAGAALGNQTGSANASSLIAINWTVPPDLGSTMKNIKVTDIQFTNMVDEYNNNLTRYNGVAADNGLTRPIQDTKGATIELSSFQLNRPNLEIRANRPRLVSSVTTPSMTTTPAKPTASGDTQNGGLLSGSTLSLVFADGNDMVVPLTAVPGKYVTIRPYGTWAIPPELTVEEFNSVYNHPNVTDNDRKRLKDVDINEIPNTGSGRGSGWNLYRKNTHGVTTSAAYGNLVRPDTSTKMILDFTTDLYDGTNAANLRAVFNTAEWKWQKISVTSSYVRIENIAPNVINITIPQTLDDGRIWEVLIDDGAFQDTAGNPSQAVAAGDYRFWSPGTATPYIRADKVSYDARNMGDNKTLGFVDASDVPMRPPVDMRVRIDCETPGADIRYDVIRTSYTLSPDTTANPPASTAFSSTTNTNDFFNHSGITTGTTGYTRNNIGNESPTNKTSEFFNMLLVPNKVDSGPTGFNNANLSNGTFLKSTLDSLGTALTLPSGGSSNARNYQTYTSSSGNRTWNTYTGDHVIYVGELWGTTSNPNSALLGSQNNDLRLYSGRRDYVAAKAVKNSITGAGANNGPALTQSDAGMEGVYKTTLLYRDPQRPSGTTYYLSRLLIQGFDVPVMPIVAGFPLRDADTTHPDNSTYSNYFSKCAWRYGTGTNYNTFSDTYLETNPTAAAGNNHIWVSWEIITDWYQKGKGFRGTTGNYLDNNQVNANSILATYGAVIYRYRQAFYN